LKNLNELFEAMGWVKLMKLDKPIYEHLSWEILSSLKVDRSTCMKNGPLHIQFHFQSAFEVNLAELDCHMKLCHYGFWNVGHEISMFQHFAVR